MTDVLLQIIDSPLLAALVAVGGVIATIRYTNRRERDRQDHERRIKDKELSAEREARIRDERIEAYRCLLAATASAHVDEEAMNALAAAIAEISLLGESPALVRAAFKVWVRYGATEKAAREARQGPATGPVQGLTKALTEAAEAREEFLKLARKELGVDR